MMWLVEGRRLTHPKRLRSNDCSPSGTTDPIACWITLGSQVQAIMTVAISTLPTRPFQRASLVSTALHPKLSKRERELEQSGSLSFLLLKD
jgi:hypothetical protein